MKPVMNGDKGLSITMMTCILAYENSGKPGYDQKYDEIFLCFFIDGSFLTIS